MSSRRLVGQYKVLPGFEVPPYELVEERREQVISCLTALDDLPPASLDGLTLQAAEGAWHVLEEEGDAAPSE